jgi:hypothetical protein
MRHKAVPAATMIVAASLIGITQARLPRPIRDYRERVGVEMSTIAFLDDNVDWLGMRHGASIGRRWRVEFIVTPPNAQRRVCGPRL